MKTYVKILGGTTVFLVGAYALIGYVLAPAWVSSILEKSLKDIDPNADFSCSSVHINPFTLNASIRGLKAQFSMQGAQWNLGFKSFSLGVDRLDLVGKSVSLGTVLLEQPNVLLTKNSKRSAKPTKKLAQATKEEKESATPSPWSWSVQSVLLKDGNFEYADSGIEGTPRLGFTHFQGEVKNLNSGKQKSTFKVSADLLQSKFSTTGSLRLSGLRVDANSKFEALQFKSLNPWAKGANFSSGYLTCSVKTTYEKNKLTASGEAHINDVATDKLSLTSLVIPNVKAQGIRLVNLDPIKFSIAKTEIEFFNKTVSKPINTVFGFLSSIAKAAGQESLGKMIEKPLLVELENIQYANGKTTIPGYSASSVQKKALDILTDLFSVFLK